jgi:hypothetical protein
MRLGLTLTRTGNTWKVESLPSVPLADQLAAFKAKQVGEGFDGVEEVLVVSLGDTLKRHIRKAKPAPAVEVEAEESPKPKKK